MTRLYVITTSVLAAVIGVLVGILLSTPRVPAVQQAGAHQVQAIHRAAK